MVGGSRGSNWLFKNAKKDSIVFIFFAGHGGVEEDRFGIEKDKLAKYLLPYDANFDNFSASALSNSDFNTLLLSIKSKRLIVFMDSCYSGGVSEKKARDVKIVEDPYEKMAEGEGRLVIAASQPDQRSFEDKNLSHGIFTYHLIEALKGKADLDNDGYVTAMEVYKYLSETVTKTARRLAGGAQEPILRGDLKTDFVLTVSRKRIEEIKDEDIKRRNLKRLSDWYHDGKFGPAQYELACRLIESSPEDLRGGDKKVLKSLNDLLSDKISISTFQHDVGIVKGLEKPPVVKPKIEEERKKEEEGEIKKKRIIELSSQAQKLFGEKKYTEAIAKWHEVLKLDSENRKTIEGIEEANRILKELEEKKRKIGDLNISAQQLYNEGKYSEAIDEWWKVLDLDLENQTAKEGIKNAEEKLKLKEREVKEEKIKDGEKLKPVEKELTVRNDIERVKLAIIEHLVTMEGKVLKSDEAYIECDFGSLLKSRLLGEFFVSKATLPKKVEIHLEGIGSNETKVKILVRDTHKYGVMWGYVEKYEKALQEVADSIVEAIE